MAICELLMHIFHIGPLETYVSKYYFIIYTQIQGISLKKRILYCPPYDIGSLYYFLRLAALVKVWWILDWCWHVYVFNQLNIDNDILTRISIVLSLNKTIQYNIYIFGLLQFSFIHRENHIYIWLCVFLHNLHKKNIGKKSYQFSPKGLLAWWNAI